MLFPLLNLGGKKFEKKSSDCLSRNLKSAVVHPPINLITIVKMSSYISLRPIFAKLGTFIHFVVNSNQEKIWVDSDIFVRVMTSSIFKCGSGPPINLFPREICLLFFRIFEKRKNIVPVDRFAWKLVRKWRTKHCVKIPNCLRQFYGLSAARTFFGMTWK